MGCGEEKTCRPKKDCFEGQKDLVVAPNQLVKLMSRHFDNYLGRLRRGNVEYGKTGKKPDLLNNFQKHFDVEITDKISGRLARLEGTRK